MGRFFMIVGCLAMMVAVAMDAYGYHILKDDLDPYFWESFLTGQRYLFHHALALVGVGYWVHHAQRPLLPILAGVCFILGGITFTGNIYALVLGDWRLPIPTPVGGLLILSGWLALGLGAFLGLSRSARGDIEDGGAF